MFRLLLLLLKVTVCLDRRATWRGPSGTVCLKLPPVGVETLEEVRGVDFKNTGLAKSTPSGTVCLDRQAIWRDYSRQVAQCV